MRGSPGKKDGDDFLNVLDMALILMLSLAFLRGFSSGIYKTAANLVGLLLSLIAAAYFAEPFAGYLDERFGLIASWANRWSNAFRVMPGLEKTYDPSAYDSILKALGPTSLAQYIRSALTQNILKVQELAGPFPSWCEVLSLALARLWVLGISFLAVLAISKLLFLVFTKALNFSSPISFTGRLLGGALESSVTFLRLSLILGILSPLLYSGIQSGIKVLAAESRLLGYFLYAYSWIWPFLLGRLGLLNGAR